MEIPIKMDDLGVPLFLETPIYPIYKDRLIANTLIRSPLILNSNGTSKWRDILGELYFGYASPGCLGMTRIDKLKKQFGS